MSHWYSKEGTPKYTVLNTSKGGERPTTLADAKKHGYVPSVTTVMQVVAKPGLDRWKQQQLLQAMATYRQNANESIESWFYRIIKASEEATKIAAARGTELHDELEDYFRHGTFHLYNEDIIEPILILIEERFNCDHAVPEASFYNEHGFGGKVDLHNPKDNWIIDYKTKAKDELLEESLVFDEHRMQLAAYRKGLALPDAVCYNLFISTTKPGKFVLIKHEEKDLQRGWEMFESLLKYWKLVNRYGV